MSKVTLGHRLAFDRRAFQARWVVWDRVPDMLYATRLLEVDGEDPEFAAFMSDKTEGQKLWLSQLGMAGMEAEYIGTRGSRHQFKLDFLERRRWSPA